MQNNLIVQNINKILNIIEKNKQKIKIIDLDISWVKLKNWDFWKIKQIQKRWELSLVIDNKTILRFKYLL